MTLVPIVNLDNQITGAFCCQTECFYVVVPGETPLEIRQVIERFGKVILFEENSGTKSSNFPSCPQKMLVAKCVITYNRQLYPF